MQIRPDSCCDSACLLFREPTQRGTVDVRSGCNYRPTRGHTATATTTMRRSTTHLDISRCRRAQKRAHAPSIEEQLKSHTP